MLFKDVIGQRGSKRVAYSRGKRRKDPSCTTDLRSRSTVKLPLAIAYARYICCENRGEQDACGICPTCVN